MSKVARFVVSVALICVPALVLSGPAGAAPADLDRAFGGDGIVQVEGTWGSTFSPEASARMAIGPEDEVFVLYSTFSPCSPPFNACTIELSLARYSRDGAREVAPNSGWVVHQDPLAHSFDLAVGPDGKPVVAATDGGFLVVARFDRDGHLDGTFGTGGIAGGAPEQTLGGPVTMVQTLDSPAVAAQADGKILVAAEAGRGPDGSELLLARLLGNGERDPGFGIGGVTALKMATQSRPANILLDAGGNISVAGPRCCAGHPAVGNGVSFARFLPGGQPDPGLAATGQLFFPTPEQSEVRSIALAPDGGIFALLDEEGRGSSVTKLLPDGSVDRGFGGEGAVVLSKRVDVISAADIVADSKGRLVGVGWDDRLAAFRLRPDGGMDRTFDGGQHVTVDFGGDDEAALAVGLQSNGRIVALGETSCCGPKAFALIGLRGGTDHTRCLRHKATIVGTRGPDELTGTPHRDVIAALGGKDIVKGRGGNDLICGGPGRDRLAGGAGRDLLRQ